jgi:hypothetical protein
VYVATGEYKWAFLIAAALELIALAVLTLVRSPQRL